MGHDDGKNDTAHQPRGPHPDKWYLVPGTGQVAGTEYRYVVPGPRFHQVVPVPVFPFRHSSDNRYI